MPGLIEELKDYDILSGHNLSRTQQILTVHVFTITQIKLHLVNFFLQPVGSLQVYCFIFKHLRFFKTFTWILTYYHHGQIRFMYQHLVYPGNRKAGFWKESIFYNLCIVFYKY